MFQRSFKTQLGYLTIQIKDSAVTKVLFGKLKSIGKNTNNELFKQVKNELISFMKGETKKINVPLNFNVGTDFQKKVWMELKKIPYGKTKTYKDIAIKIGSPKAARAIGMACNKNPFPLIIPCHRIIGSNGSLTGFASGVDVKRALLSLEKK